MNNRFPYARIGLTCEQALYDDHDVLSSKDAICLLTKHLFSYTVENSVVLYLNAEGLPLCVAFTGIGDRGNCAFDITQTAQVGLLCGARSFILLHNHPIAAQTINGMAASVPDKETTESIVKACRPLGLYCLDSIVASSYIKDGRVTPAYYSLKEKETYHLMEEYLQADALMVDLGSIQAKTKALPIVRLTFQSRKYFKCSEVLTPPDVKNLLYDVILTQDRAMDFVILTDCYDMPLCILSTHDAKGHFDPADIAKIGLLYNAHYFLKVHQEPNSETYKTYIRSKKTLEDAKEIASISAPVSLFFRDSIAFNITEKNQGFPPRQSVFLHAPGLLYKLNGQKTVHGTLVSAKKRDGNIPWATEEDLKRQIRDEELDPLLKEDLFAAETLGQLKEWMGEN